MSEIYEINGATVDLTSPSEGETTWTVQQKDAEFEIEFPEDHARINFDYGPVKLVDGYVDKATLDIVVAPVVNQVYIGLIEGSLKDGLSVKFNLSSSDGRFELFLKNGNELWLELDLRIRFGGMWNHTQKIFSF